MQGTNDAQFVRNVNLIIRKIGSMQIEFATKH